MLMRSIYGETPEGAVPVEDRGPNKEKCEKHFAKQSKLGWGPNREKGTSIVNCIMNCNDLTAINRQGIGIVSDFSFLIGE